MGFKVLRKGMKKGFEGELLLVKGCSIKNTLDGKGQQ